MIASGLILAVLLATSPLGGTGPAHGSLRNPPCIECHVRLPFPGSTLKLRNDIGGVCNTCHKHYHGTDAMLSHPIQRVTSIEVPPDMLLDDQGRIVCITCHAFHGEYRDEEGNKKYYLRRTPGKTFCFSCHKNI